MRIGRVTPLVCLASAGILSISAACSDGTDAGTGKPATGGTGPAGRPDAAGSSGAGGSSGSNGTTGAAGSSGASGGSGGSSGSSGATGSSGTDGASGDGGASGTADASRPDADAGNGAARGKSAGCGKPASSGDTPGRFVRRSIAVTGVDPALKPATAGGSWTDRVYYLDLPTGYDPTKAYPLLFGGAGCGGALTTNGNNGGFAVLPANNNQAIQIGLSYVWPEGSGPCFYDGVANTPDLPYFDSVLKEVEENYCVNRDRIFVGGFSSGGWLAYTLGLARGGIIRGISPAAGGLRPAANRPGASNQPIAALLLTGENDTSNPATGPTGSDAARDHILALNGCQGTDTTPWSTCAGCGCVKYTGCPDAFPVIRCRPPGQGHTDGGGAFKSAIWSVWSALP
jgi:poly(3-hydroxybutyrate) depolymerase